MKLLKIKFKKTNAKDIADAMGTNGFVNLLSYTVSGGMFDDYIEMFIAVPEEKSDKAQVVFKDFIVKI